jgi:hypothetical protein
MIEYQQRVVDEFNELVERRSKLGSFITSNSLWHVVPMDEQRRMVRQYDVMLEYEAVLRDRIAHFKLAEN